MSTAGEQINRALRLLGVLAEGEQPSTSTSDDALVALNQMLDSWSTERLSVYTTTTQIFTWPAGQASRTLGPSGDFVGLRPILLDESTYYVYNQLSFPISIVNQDQYNSIVLKTVNSLLPGVLFVDTAYPDVTIKLYPVPTDDLEFHFVSVLPLTQVSDPTIELFFPPGYLRAFAYNLAIELAAEFGVSAPKDVKDIANASKRNIKRINQSQDLMTFPAILVGRRGGFTNIFTGPN